MIAKILQCYLPLTRYPYVGEISHCPVCAGADATLVASLDRRLKRLPTVSCDSCGLLFTNPLPTEDELDTYYREVYRFDYHLAIAKPREYQIRKARRLAEARAADVAGMLKPGLRTLDVGCGSGDLVAIMLEAGCDAYGLEPGETYSTYAKRGLGNRVQPKNWRNATFVDEFDLITCFDVLEHLRDPIPALQRIARWLAPNGRAYIHVPDLGTVEDNKGFGALHFAHVLGFNHHNFVLAASRAGLQPERTMSPTGIIFRHGVSADAASLAADGLQLSRQLYGKGGAYWRYLRHQARKIGCCR